MGKRLNKQTIQTIALTRIHRLFYLAEEKARQRDFPLANRYVDLARNISMKCNVRIPSHLKQQYCKQCYHYLLPDVTCRIRFHRGKRIITCYHCKNTMRKPLHKP